VRNAKNPISQVAKRETEMEKNLTRRHLKPKYTYVSEKLKDSCFLTINGKYAFVREKRRKDPCL
jgi:hypothetical protein